MAALTAAFMLDRVRARDRSFDRAFLFGVKTTGVYCRPSCSARAANEENIRFFDTPSAARAAGLRPCLRCRPDEFLAGQDPELAVVEGVLARLVADPAAFPSVDALTAASGFGTTRFHSLVRAHLHTTPAALLHRERLRRAADLLLGTRFKVSDIALEVGYESHSAFHENFGRTFHLAPGDYRKLSLVPEFQLSLPAGFRPAETLAFLGRVADSPSERVAGATVTKAVQLDDRTARLEISLGAGTARCRIAAPGPLSPVGARQAHAIALRLLGLVHDPAPFERKVAERGLGRLVEGRRGLRIPQSAAVWDGLVWSILGQQVNLAFAFTMWNRLVELAGRDTGDGFRVAPGPAEVARIDEADLLARQFSRRKAEYLLGLARAVAAGELDLETLPAGTATRAERTLLAQRGLGPWSVQYVLLRACGFADAVPVGDSGLTTALARFFELSERPDPRHTETLMAPFAPYRSFATTHLWHTLEVLG
ncbi:MAG: Ada metal-binding domain-containing protein [Thermoanaerobaculia bacterium]|nr:Ada metal-binding domain-containing protein [Thermoanaerobaculia bacterium]